MSTPSRDDGLSYGDYVEQLTFLLFLKMADEQTRPPYNKPSAAPAGYAWPELLKRSGDDLEAHYRHTLEELGRRGGMLGLIFRKAQNKIQDPAKLQRLIVDLIDREQWTSLSTDVKGDAFEGLLQKNAEDVKGGAGNTSRPGRLSPPSSTASNRGSASRSATRPWEPPASCSRRTTTSRGTPGWTWTRSGV